MLSVTFQSHQAGKQKPQRKESSQYLRLGSIETSLRKQSVTPFESNPIRAPPLPLRSPAHRRRGRGGRGPWVLWPSALCHPLGWNSPYSHRGLLQVSRLQSLRVPHKKELGQEFLQIVRPGEHLLRQLTDRCALDHPRWGSERQSEKGHQRCFPTSGLNVSPLRQGVPWTPRTLSPLDRIPPKTAVHQVSGLQLWGTRRGSGWPKRDWKNTTPVSSRCLENTRWEKPIL